jgi:hypothetical protein
VGVGRRELLHRGERPVLAVVAVSRRGRRRFRRGSFRVRSPSWSSVVPLRNIAVQKAGNAAAVLTGVW